MAVTQREQLQAGVRVTDRFKSPKTGQRRSLRAIAAELAMLGHVGPSAEPYHAGSIRHMLAA